MSPEVTVEEVRKQALDQLKSAQVESPQLDADLLLAEVLGVDRGYLIANPKTKPNAAQLSQFDALIARRVKREPVAYILGRKGFRRIELQVNHAVLIPRPDTELLVEVAKIGRPRNLLDVATGSGAVALALAQELPEATITATDISPAALSVAEANAKQLGMSERVRFISSDLLEGVEGRFDCITANLPYVTDDEWPGLASEINRYEPRLALVAGDDGLDLVRRLIPAARVHLNPKGMLALEIAGAQAAAVLELMARSGYSDVRTHKDLAGTERVVSGRVN